VGLENGSIITLNYLSTPNNGKKLQAMSVHNNHIKPITAISISPCNKYLISTGTDCMIFVYNTSLTINGIKQEEDNGISNSSVDDFLSDVVLYQKKEIRKYDEK
jgi:WD40 repeat protein